MSNEVVKHHNDLNTVIMRKWTSEEMNFFFSVLAKARDKGTKRLFFDTGELKELSNFSKVHNQRWEDTMENVARKVTQLNYVEKTEKRIRAMTLFNWFEVNLESRTIEVELSTNFEYIINKLQANFTVYELEEFTHIRSTYAKTTYRLLKQWRTVGKKEFNIDEFKNLLDMPNYYGPSHIDKNVLTPIKKELAPYFENLKVKKVKANTRGTPVTGYIFTWNPEKTGKWDPNKYEKKQLGKKVIRKETLPDWFGKETTEDDYIDPEVEKDFKERLRQLREEKE